METNEINQSFTTTISKYPMNEIESSFYYGAVRWMNKDVKLVPQVEIVSGSNKRRFDFAVSFESERISYDINKFKFAIELDGRKDHSGLDNEKKDDQKDLWVGKLGWEVRHFTGEDVHHNLLHCFEYLEYLIGIKVKILSNDRGLELIIGSIVDEYKKQDKLNELKSTADKMWNDVAFLLNTGQISPIKAKKLSDDIFSALMENIKKI